VTPEVAVRVGFDGRHTFEVNGKKAVVEIYTVGGVLHFALTVDGRLITRDDRAEVGQTHQALLERLNGVVARMDS